MEEFEFIRQKICELYNVEEKKVTKNTCFLEDLQSDSLDIAELAIELENRYNIIVSDKQLESMHTIGDAVNYIKQLNNVVKVTTEK